MKIENDAPPQGTCLKTHNWEREKPSTQQDSNAWPHKACALPYCCSTNPVPKTYSIEMENFLSVTFWSFWFPFHDLIWAADEIGLMAAGMRQILLKAFERRRLKGHLNKLRVEWLKSRGSRKQLVTLKTYSCELITDGAGAYRWL